LTILCLCATVLLIPIIHSYNVNTDKKEDIEQEIEDLVRAVKQRGQFDSDDSSDDDDNSVFDGCVDTCQDNAEPFACLLVCLERPVKKSVQQRGWWRRRRTVATNDLPRLPW